MPLPPFSAPLDRLARLRGPLAPKAYDARKITALTTNPACDRRTVLDAAGIDKAALARRVGFDPRFGQSPFTITRGLAFEELVKRDGYAELLRLLREQTGTPIAEAAVADLNEVGGNGSLTVRHKETARLIDRLAAGDAERLILDHPVLTMEVAGRTAILEPDALTHRVGGRFHLVEIKSFPAIDGVADPLAVAEAAKQAAVYAIALRQAFKSAGYNPELVAEEFLLVCPKDFGNRPYGRLVDLRQERENIAFQLTRLRRAEDLAVQLPDDATFDVRDDSGHSSAQLTQSVSALNAAYTPGCLSFCEMARFCRQEAEESASPARLGSAVRNVMPGLDSTRTVLEMLDGTGSPAADPGQAEVLDRLRKAERLRRARRTAVA
ncbi:hypothetical protein [Kitasatospora kifunensis]|uniref:Secreted protein n=1 Tax=Kitasatospora kifunensis TaxID=58351 RepID=A0A7W7QY20_KITKI|nr:hypothetical protein [Kitasatospora kifunensis]MBB4921902.1 hypothetical protein [Kitasatospora kifunensis]